MRGIIRSRQARLFGVALAVVFATVLAGAGPQERVSAQVGAIQSSGTVTIQKALVLPGGGAAVGDLSGYTFTITPSGTSTAITAGPTNAAGQTAPLALPEGTYTISETARAGATLVNFTVGGTSIGVPGFFSITAGTATVINAVNQVAGSSSIVITKQIVDVNNQVLAGASLAGFSFAVAGPNNFRQTLTTDATGRLTLSNLAAGVYSVTEQPAAGFTLATVSGDGFGTENGRPFEIGAAQTRQLVFQNRQGAATGTVTVTKQMVDQAGTVLTAADRSGFQFTVACAATATTQAFSQVLTTDGSGIATFSGVPGGLCTIREADRTGFTNVSTIVSGTTNDIGNGGPITVAAGQNLAVTVRNRASQAPPQPTVAEPLFTGCNNVALTWPAGTPIATVAASVAPANILISIFRYDNAQGRFFGFSPNVPAFVNDYTQVIRRFEPVFICVNGPGVLNRPDA